MKALPFKPSHEITQYAEILNPEDAEPPILSLEIRLAVRQWLAEINAADELKSYGLKPRKTALFSGPPGCGKTTLAHHFAARLGLPLVVVNMASLVGNTLGASGKNVNALFDALGKQMDSCLLFMDEFDSVATRRTKDNQACARELNSLVISLLQKIDTSNGLIIAATNRGDDIDPALWRRFGMHLEILEPDDEARFAILKRYLAPLTLPESALTQFADLTDGASPAVLRQLMEAIKRDLVLSPKYGQDTSTPAPVFSRILATIRPHADVKLTALWNDQAAMEKIAALPWPPVDGRQTAT